VGLIRVSPPRQANSYPSEIPIVTNTRPFKHSPSLPGLPVSNLSVVLHCSDSSHFDHQRFNLLGRFARIHVDRKFSRSKRMVTIRQVHQRSLLCSSSSPADGAPVPRHLRSSTTDIRHAQYATAHARGSFPRFPLATFTTVSSHARPSPKLQSAGLFPSTIPGSHAAVPNCSLSRYSSDAQPSDSSGLNINNIWTLFPSCHFIVVLVSTISLFFWI
jgi:hypothetical protein